jgi:hypothetical protein
MVAQIQSLGVIQMAWPYDVDPRALIQQALTMQPQSGPMSFGQATRGGWSGAGQGTPGGAMLPGMPQASQPTYGHATQAPTYFGPTHQAASQLVQGLLAPHIPQPQAAQQGAAQGAPGLLTQDYTPTGMTSPYAVNWFPPAGSAAAPAASYGGGQAVNPDLATYLAYLAANQGSADGATGNGGAGGVGSAAAADSASTGGNAVGGEGTW